MISEAVAFKRKPTGGAERAEVLGGAFWWGAGQHQAPQAGSACYVGASARGRPSRLELSVQGVGSGAGEEGRHTSSWGPVKPDQGHTDFVVILVENHQEL